jgi:hypothetical protein
VLGVRFVMFNSVLIPKEEAVFSVNSGFYFTGIKMGLKICRIAEGCTSIQTPKGEILEIEKPFPLPPCRFSGCYETSN